MKIVSFQTGALYLLTWPQFSSPLEYFQLELVVHSNDYAKSVIALHAGRRTFFLKSYHVEKVDIEEKVKKTKKETIYLQHTPHQITNYPLVFSGCGIRLRRKFCVSKRWRIEPTSTPEVHNQLETSSHEPSQYKVRRLLNKEENRKLDMFLILSGDLILALRNIASRPESGTSTFTWRRLEGPRLVTDLDTSDFAFSSPAGTEHEPKFDTGDTSIAWDNEKINEELNLNDDMKVQINLGKLASDVPTDVYEYLNREFNTIKHEWDEKNQKNCIDMYKSMPSLRIIINQRRYKFTSEEYVFEMSKQEEDYKKFQPNCFLAMRPISGLDQKRWIFGATFAKRHPVSMRKKDENKIEYAIHETQTTL
uniref:AlNc14C18G1839 protein n=1 Tax=Albugo laibachii Nc14 TaxID=890382 RepID=F0W4L8_9STRA|nr:AlNc14C18G1839 [Albugo laibachii Nc14]|eukprot:CCA16052.1 AlNc14C18G1839 [Albugo laibachii Nc14]